MANAVINLQPTTKFGTCPKSIPSTHYHFFHSLFGDNLKKKIQKKELIKGDFLALAFRADPSFVLHFISAALSWL